MVRAKAKVEMQPEKVLKAAKKASVDSLARAGAYVRGIARKSIRVAKSPSKPGKPPRTRKGRLKNAIFFAADKAKSDVVIGPAANEVGKIGHTHEFGGTEPPKKKTARHANWKLEVGGHGPIRADGKKPKFARLKTARQVERAKVIAPQIPASQGGAPSNKPRNYPARPFMGPALVIARERLPKLWANSVKGV